MDTNFGNPNYPPGQEKIDDLEILEDEDEEMDEPETLIGIK